MANNSGVITAPISCVSDVPIVLGLGTYDIGEQIVKASVGGKDTTLIGGTKIKGAFNVIENGSNEFDGTLIDGAKPYWNIFSNESPGAWEASNAIDEKLIFRLKPFAKDKSKGYGYNLDEFDGYNHNSIGPDDIVVNIKVPVGASISQQVTIKAKTGSYDWRKLTPGIPVAVKFIIFDESNNQVGESDAQELTAINMNINLSATVNIISTSNPSTKTYTIREYFGRKTSADFTSFGYVPITGIMTVTVYTPIPEASFAIRMDGAPNTSWSISSFDKVANKWIINAKFRRNSATEITRSLYKIEYTLVDELNNIGSSVTITTGFTVNDAPQSLYDYGADSGYGTVQFNVQYDRLIPTVTYPQVKIIMYYK